MQLKLSRKLLFGLVGMLVVSLVTVIGISMGSKKKAPFSPGEAVTRRLSPEQYRTIIHDVFGPTVDLGGRFEPDLRVEGLLAVGASKVSVSPAGMEQYDAMARSIASQVLDERHRDLMLACKPNNVAEPDDGCAGQFLAEVGRLLFRRPLTQEEGRAYIKAAHDATTTVGDFYTGLSLSLAAMLESPQFVFRQDVLEPDPDHDGEYRLDAYSKASRLSFFLWNSAPDLPLLEAAERGELHTRKGMDRQVERMLASPRLEAGVRAFFADMLMFSEFETLTKDNVIYPKFNPRVAADSQEQTLRTIVDLVLTQRGDYRDLFTTRKTFMTQALASIYRVPLVKDSPNGSPDQWQPYEFAADDPRAGILMQTSFVTLHSHPGRGSPTLRGAALRKVMMCQKIPAAPADVNFAIVQDTDNPEYKTARDRLTAHRTNAACAGCHKVMDPMGLALENFDGGGEWRAMENGVVIDTSGELDGVHFNDGVGLGKAVRDNPATASCLVDRLTAYALGRVIAPGEKPWVKDLKQTFTDEGYVLPDLMRQISTSEEFYRAAAPRLVDAPADKVAMAAMNGRTSAPELQQ